MFSNNQLGYLQNGLKDRGYQVRRVERDGLVIISATAKRNAVELRFRQVARGFFQQLTTD